MVNWIKSPTWAMLAPPQISAVFVIAKSTRYNEVILVMLSLLFVRFVSASLLLTSTKLEKLPGAVTSQTNVMVSVDPLFKSSITHENPS